MMRRGEVWLISLDPTVGAEIKKTRPAVIVSDDTVGILPLKIVVPLISWKDRYATVPWLVRVDPDVENNLDKPSGADAFRVRSIDQRRFLTRIGTIAPHLMSAISRALAAVLHIETK